MKKYKVVCFLLAISFLFTTCSPFFLEYDNPVDPRADSYQGYTTVSSVNEVTGDFPEEEAVWCVFCSSVVANNGSDMYALRIYVTTLN